MPFRENQDFISVPQIFEKDFFNYVSALNETEIAAREVRPTL